MQTASADPKVEELTPEGLKRSHQNILEEFAQNMSENIIQSFMSRMETEEPEVDCQVSRNQEVLAEELASAVVEVALREACRGPNMEDYLAGVKMDGGQKMDPGQDAQPSLPSLSRSGLPIVGSLDWPDAPPTTPLLPELERSRHSFARKLKGGLATVFLPSPPPPTPKDKEDGSSNDPQVELIEHLMDSLSTHDLARDNSEGGSHNEAKMEAFAEAFSRDIIDWVLSDENREQITSDGDLHVLAHQLAETIITSSLDEAKMLF